jgi:hypothetical protein
MLKLHHTIGPEIHRKMRQITGRETSGEQSRGTIRCSHPRDTQVRLFHFRHLYDTKTGVEMLEITQKSILDNKVEVTTYFINEENMKNCPHIDFKI